jgi:hypothetical protein
MAKKRATKQAAPPGRSAWKQMKARESQPAKKPGRRRLAVVYDTNGPRIRLGLGWFALTVVALALGVWGVAFLYSAAAGIAALQTAREWRKSGAFPHRVAAGAGAAAIGIAGAISTRLVGIVILGFVGAAVFLASSAAAATKRRKVRPIDDAAFTVRCALFAGLAAACMAITMRISATAAVGLVLIVAAYEVGDYIVGSGARNAFEGPIAGATAIVVVTFAITVVGLKPFVFPDSFVLAGTAAVLCPAGQLLASLILPKVDAAAGALRRIDSLLILAPVWAFAVSRLI